MSVFKRLTVTVAAVAALVGILPPPPAQAFQGPVAPIAPPVTGFCATPWGAVACIGAGAAAVGGEALLWWESSMIGFVPTEDGWCMTDTGHMFQEGSASCTTPTVNTTDTTEQLVRDQFEGVVTAFDQYGDYLWFPAGSASALGFEIIAARTNHDGGRGYTATVFFEPGDDACSTYNGENTGSGGYNPNYSNLNNCISVLPTFSPGTPFSPQGSSQNYLVGTNFTGPTCGPFDNPHHIWSLSGSAGESWAWHGSSASCFAESGRHARMTARTGDPDGYVLIRDARDPNNIGHHFISMERDEMQFEGEYKTTTACRDADGTVTIRQATSLDSFVVGAASGSLPQAGCLAGEVPVSTSVELCDANGPTCLEVANWTAPPMTDAEYGCFINAGGGGEVCPMWLEYWDGSTWQECVPAVAGECTDWWTNPGRDLIFRCGWGGDYYSASQCQPLKNWYNVDEPTDETDLEPVNPGDPNPDPGVGAPVVTPDPETGHLPGTISGPSSPPSSRPTEPWLERIITEWSTGSTASMQGACWPQGWGLLNPLQWVMRPIMCALTFLFVPQTPVATQLEVWLDEAATTTKLGLVYDAGALVGDIPSPAVGSACGWGIPSIEAPDLEVPETQLIMCPSDYGLTAQASTARNLGYGVLGLWVVGMVYRWIGLGSSNELQLESDNVSGNL